MNNVTKPKIVVIQGPTACGKTALSIQLATSLKGEIISADSRQFYQEMNIGTAKPNKQELAAVKHHFVGFESVRNPVNVSGFEKLALAAIEKILNQNKIPFVVGGSGLFADAITKGLNFIPEIDPEVRAELNDRFKTNGIEVLLKQLEQLDPTTFTKIDRQNPRRIIRALEVCKATGKPFSFYLGQKLPPRKFDSIKIAIDIPLKILYSRIEKRCDQMITNGLLKEVEGLIECKEFSSLHTIGYTEFFDYFEGNYLLHEAITKFKQHSRNYAKRQMTWLRKDKDIKWFTGDDSQAIQDYLIQMLN